MLADSGATDTIFRQADSHLLTDIQQGSIAVQLPNGATISSIGEGVFRALPDAPDIPAHIFRDEDLNRSLVSLVDYCDKGCSVQLTSTDITITDTANNIVLQSVKRPEARLWTIPTRSAAATHSTVQAMSSTQEASAATIMAACHNVIRHELNAERVAFYHACFGSPAPVAFVTALQRGYINIPYLTAAMVSANLPNSMATAKGHLDLIRQGLRSTTPAPSVPLIALADDTSLDPTPFAALVAKTISISDINHSDLTGRFPQVSRRGNQYLLVSYFNGYVHCEPMRDRAGPSFVDAYRRTLLAIQQPTYPIRQERMDNECDAVLASYFRAEGITPQFVPPHNHRTNQAERAIRDVKNHLISMLATANPAFPLDLWDEFIPQVNITINHLRPFVPNPSISAYHGIHGSQFDFDAHPIAPQALESSFMSPQLPEQPGQATVWRASISVQPLTTTAVSMSMSAALGTTASLIP